MAWPAPRHSFGAMNWPDDNDTTDPAMKPLIEAGQGEAEGFELAERDLIRHATDVDSGSTNRIIADADQRDEEDPDAVFSEADEAVHPDA